MTFQSVARISDLPPQAAITPQLVEGARAPGRFVPIFHTAGSTGKVINALALEGPRVFPQDVPDLVKPLSDLVTSRAGEFGWNRVSLTLLRGPDAGRVVLDDITQHGVPHRGKIIVRPAAHARDALDKENTSNEFVNEQDLRVHKEALLRRQQASNDVMVVLYGTNEMEIKPRDSNSKGNLVDGDIAVTRALWRDAKPPASGPSIYEEQQKQDRHFEHGIHVAEHQRQLEQEEIEREERDRALGLAALAAAGLAATTVHNHAERHRLATLAEERLNEARRHGAATGALESQIHNREALRSATERTQEAEAHATPGLQHAPGAYSELAGNAVNETRERQQDQDREEFHDDVTRLTNKIDTLLSYTYDIGVRWSLQYIRRIVGLMENAWQMPDFNETAAYSILGNLDEVVRDFTDQAQRGITEGDDRFSPNDHEPGRDIPDNTPGVAEIGSERYIWGLNRGGYAEGPTHPSEDAIAHAEAYQEQQQEAEDEAREAAVLAAGATAEATREAQNEAVYNQTEALASARDNQIEALENASEQPEYRPVEYDQLETRGAEPSGAERVETPRNETAESSAADTYEPAEPVSAREAYNEPNNPEPREPARLEDETYNASEARLPEETPQTEPASPQERVSARQADETNNAAEAQQPEAVPQAEDEREALRVARTGEAPTEASAPEGPYREYAELEQAPAELNAAPEDTAAGPQAAPEPGTGAAGAQATPDRVIEAAGGDTSAPDQTASYQYNEAGEFRPERAVMTEEQAKEQERTEQTARIDREANEEAHVDGEVLKHAAEPPEPPESESGLFSSRDDERSPASLAEEDAQFTQIADDQRDATNYYMGDMVGSAPPDPADRLDREPAILLRDREEHREAGDDAALGMAITQGKEDKAQNTLRPAIPESELEPVEKPHPDEMPKPEPE